MCTLKNLIKMMVLYGITVCCGAFLSTVIHINSWMRWIVVSGSTVGLGVVFLCIYLLIFDKESYRLITNIIGIKKNR